MFTLTTLKQQKHKLEKVTEEKMVIITLFGMKHCLHIYCIYTFNRKTEQHADKISCFGQIDNVGPYLTHFLV